MKKTARPRLQVEESAGARRAALALASAILAHKPACNAPLALLCSRLGDRRR